MSIGRYLLVVSLLVVPSFGATYKGKNIDGKKYSATIRSDKEIFAGSVMFDGQFAHLSFNGQLITVKLESETIQDLRRIPANDKTDRWEITVEEDPF